MDRWVGGVQWIFAEFECYTRQFWEVGRGPIGLVSSLRFTMLDYQPEESSTGPVSTDFHDLGFFRKRCHGCLTRYLSCFRPGRPKVGFSLFSVEIKKMRDEKLCRFVVVSPLEVPYLTFS